MAYDRFLIAPFNTGLQQDLKPFMIADDAFAELNNAYVFRGRVRKRFGTQLLGNGTGVSDEELPFYSRLRINIGTTAAATGNFTSATPLVSGIVFAIGQAFSIGSTMFTVTALGSPAVLKTTGAATATLDTASGLLTVTGNNENPSTDVFFYPSLPVMGLIGFEEAATNDETTFGFDTRFAYRYVGNAWERLGTAVWTGNDTQFFWGTNYRGASAQNTLFFVTNYNTADNIKYWNGTVWTNFAPRYNPAVPGDIVQTARIIIPFKNRLVLLNTVENTGGVNQTFVNRARWSQIGDPVAADAFYFQAGKGSFEDASTKEAIISAQIIKDRLIVFFERSTWEFVYTGNEILPFRWQKINSELGAESTFSVVLFDKVLLGIGNTGIHACNGANVERIDNKIPDTVFNLLDTSQGPTRVQGIRDYYSEMVYWTFPEEGTTYPQRVLVYNYQNGSWAFNDDSFTTFGYNQIGNNTTWASTEETWEESVGTWGGPAQQQGFRQVIAGNQQGWTFILDRNASNNDPSLQITNLTYTTTLVTLTIINHNLTIDDYVLIKNCEGTTELNDFIFKVNTVEDQNTVTILPVDPNNLPIIVTGTYTGFGTVSRVSIIDVLTKQFNPYAKAGKNIYLAKVDFNVDKTPAGAITVDYYPSFSTYSMIQGGDFTGALIGNNVLETSPYTLQPFEQQQTQLWHPIYFQSDGETIQLRIYLANDQLRDNNIANSDFQLNAMVLYTMPVSRLQ